MNSKIMYLTLFISFLLPGILSAFTPYLTRKTESFGVAITEEIYHSDRMKKIRKQYSIKALVVLILISLITSYYFSKFPEPINIYVYSVGLFVMLIALFFVYLKFHFLVKGLKKKEGWIESKKQVSLTDLSFRQRKIKHSNLWFIIPLIITIGTMIITYLNYDLIPDRIPMQYDFQGNPNKFKDKSLITVFFPTFFQIMMIGLFIFINNIISKSKQQLNPSDPEGSALQNEIFRRKWSAFTIISGILMVLIFTLMQISFFVIIDPSLIFSATMLITLMIVIFSLYLAITLGQGGSRIKTQASRNNNEIDRDQDEYWKLGQFYFNPQDPAVFIEKRFGIGWTINFGSKKGWLYIAILFAFIIFSIFIDF